MTPVITRRCRLR